MTAREELGVALFRAVLDSGRAQILIARDLGITQKHLSSMMQGHALPTLAIIERASRVLGIDFRLEISDGNTFVSISTDE